MFERSLKALAITLALFLPVGLSLAADTKSERKTDTKTERKKSESKLSKDDERFVKDAAAGGMMEVELGKMAAEKAASDKVKEFGRRMQQDHGKANEELKTIAANKGVELPKVLEGKYKKTVDRLAKLSGEEFDRQYMRAMVEDHEEDLKKFERAAEKAKDPDVKQFASKHAPVIKQHLELAKTTEQEVKKSVRPSPAKESPAKGSAKDKERSR
jgi:putative membrane protein